MTAAFGFGKVTVAPGLVRDISQKMLLMPTADVDFELLPKFQVSLDLGFSVS